MDYQTAFLELSHRMSREPPCKVARKGMRRIRRGHLYLANIAPFGSRSRIEPVVVIQSDQLNNLDFPSTIVVPCHEGHWPESALRVRLPKSLFSGDRTYYCAIDCIRMINNVRFRKWIGALPPGTFKRVLRNIERILGIDSAHPEHRSKEKPSPRRHT